MRQRRQPEIIAGRVNADGTIAAGDAGFTSRRNSLGNYTLTFPGFRLLSINAMSAGFFYPIVRSVSGADNAALLLVSSSLGGGASVDTAFDFIAVGIQT